MPIPEAQLQTWSHRGAEQSASDTYTSLKTALVAPSSLVATTRHEVYLQGSYCNATNIRGDSDVDVVVQLDASFSYDLAELQPFEKQSFDQHFRPATISLQQFRADVIRSLRAYFGAGAVTEGDKCVNVAGGPGRLPSDVVVCQQYRRYRTFLAGDRQDYVEGMLFYTQSDHRPIVNYPKVHRDNGRRKNGRTGEWYKPTVRMFKNMRNVAEAGRLIHEDIGSSYFVECLLYNAPDHLYGRTFATTFERVVNWLLQAEHAAFCCQNEQLPLFGPTPEQWSEAKASRFLSGLVRLWNEW